MGLESGWRKSTGTGGGFWIGIAGAIEPESVAEFIGMRSLGFREVPTAQALLQIGAVYPATERLPPEPRREGRAIPRDAEPASLIYSLCSAACSQHDGPSSRARLLAAQALDSQQR